MPESSEVRPDRQGRRYLNPWGQGSQQHSVGSFLRWVLWNRIRDRAANQRRRTDRGAWAARFPSAVPCFAAPRAAPDAVSVTWIGHSSFLVQIGGYNVLIDPMWSDRASPFSWAGPRRWAAPGVAFDALPPIDVVLISHDHYDHLDEPTVRRLTARTPTPRWFAPVGVGTWLARRGAREITEATWGDRSTMVSTGGPGSVLGREPLEITATPAQHFSGRSVRNRNETLWCGWVVRVGKRAVWFVGDTGRHPVFADVGRRHGPFDVILMPIGAYDPQWFMGPVHIAPEDAVAAFTETVSASPMGDSGAPPPAVMVAMHWGTFQLTTEPMDEPPERARRAWLAAQLPSHQLWIPRYGETRTF